MIPRQDYTIVYAESPFNKDGSIKSNNPYYDKDLPNNPYYRIKGGISADTDTPISGAGRYIVQGTNQIIGHINYDHNQSFLIGDGQVKTKAKWIAFAGEEWKTEFKNCQNNVYIGDYKIPNGEINRCSFIYTTDTGISFEYPFNDLIFIGSYIGLDNNTMVITASIGDDEQAHCIRWTAFANGVYTTDYTQEIEADVEWFGNAVIVNGQLVFRGNDDAIYKVDFDKRKIEQIYAVGGKLITQIVFNEKTNTIFFISGYNLIKIILDTGETTSMVLYPDLIQGYGKMGTCHSNPPTYGSPILVEGGGVMWEANGYILLLPEAGYGGGESHYDEEQGRLIYNSSQLYGQGEVCYFVIKEEDLSIVENWNCGATNPTFRSVISVDAEGICFAETTTSLTYNVTAQSTAWSYWQSRNITPPRPYPEPPDPPNVVWVFFVGGSTEKKIWDLLGTESTSINKTAWGSGKTGICSVPYHYTISWAQIIETFYYFDGHAVEPPQPDPKTCEGSIWGQITNAKNGGSSTYSFFSGGLSACEWLGYGYAHNAWLTPSFIASKWYDAWRSFGEVTIQNGSFAPKLRPPAGACEKLYASADKFYLCCIAQTDDVSTRENCISLPDKDVVLPKGSNGSLLSNFITASDRILCWSVDDACINYLLVEQEKPTGGKK